VAARRTALELVKRAGALLLSGDQHLASLVRHGLDRFDDGPVQFVAPAAGSAWQRWFEPAGGLPTTGTESARATGWSGWTRSGASS
jgi:alkaline phosphatase D